jgi:hypothetical protein
MAGLPVFIVLDVGAYRSIIWPDTKSTFKQTH